MALRAGFVGLGNIGRPMAERLVGGGLPTTVFDVAAEPLAALAEAGAHAARSLREVAERSEVVGVCVRDDDDVRAVVLGEHGLLAAAKPGAVIAIHSTVQPDTVRGVAAEAAARGVGVLDAPITGGAAKAATGELIYMVGGDAEHLERARPAFETAGRIVHTGPVGTGAIAKLCNNVMTYLEWAAAFESFALARAAGLAFETLEEVTRGNGNLTEPMQAYLALHKLPPEARASEAMQKVLRGHMEVAEKDLAWALQLARKHGLTLPGAGLVSQMMARIYAVDDPGRR